MEHLGYGSDRPYGLPLLVGYQLREKSNKKYEREL